MNLNNVQHIQRFRRLPYSKNDLLIVGSGTLALLGLKKNDDIDFWMTENVARRMKNDRNFIAKKSKLDGSVLYETSDGALEGGTSFPPFKNIKEHLKRAIVVYGIHFQNPKDVLRWKRYMNRPKDQPDIKKLENYIKNKMVESHLNTLETLI